MIGLYLGCNSNTLTNCKKEFAKLHEANSLPQWLNIEGEVVGHKTTETSRSHYLNEDPHYLAISGWFLYKNKLNDIKALFDDLCLKGEDALENITGGLFIAYFNSSEHQFVFNDPMGLSNHFYIADSSDLHLAPSIAVFERSHIKLELDETLSSFLDKRGHLFGSFTKYKNVRRMEPGSILYMNGSSRSYFDLHAVEKIPLSQIVDRFSTVIGEFPKARRQLPITGGLDSRLMLSAAPFTFGYCYGPPNSADRPIARQFASEFDNFIEFEFGKTSKNGNEAAVYEELCETPAPLIKEDFLASYRYANTLSKNANIVFDGFLGGALQRGAWMHLGGILGELYRFFPYLYTLRKVDAQTILKRRYRNLSPEEFELFFKDFVQRTKDLELGDYAKVTYYEFLWSRGARFINNGALIINGQFGQIVPMFADPVTFKSLITEDFGKTMRYQTVCRIWKSVEDKFKQVKFENGYKISTPNFIKPKISLMWRLLSRYVPGFGNYGNS